MRGQPGKRKSGRTHGNVQALEHGERELRCGDDLGCKVKDGEDEVHQTLPNQEEALPILTQSARFVVMMDIYYVPVSISPHEQESSRDEEGEPGSNEERAREGVGEAIAAEDRSEGEANDAHRWTGNSMGLESEFLYTHPQDSSRRIGRIREGSKGSRSQPQNEKSERCRLAAKQRKRNWTEGALARRESSKSADGLGRYYY
jgi:hypothetical protein